MAGEVDPFAGDALAASPGADVEAGAPPEAVDALAGALPALDGAGGSAGVRATIAAAMARAGAGAAPEDEITRVLKRAAMGDPTTDFLSAVSMSSKMPLGEAFNRIRAGQITAAEKLASYQTASAFKAATLQNAEARTAILEQNAQAKRRSEIQAGVNAALTRLNLEPADLPKVTDALARTLVTSPAMDGPTAFALTVQIAQKVGARSRPELKESGGQLYDISGQAPRAVTPLAPSPEARLSGEILALPPGSPQRKMLEDAFTNKTAGQEFSVNVGGQTFTMRTGGSSNRLQGEQMKALQDEEINLKQATAQIDALASKVKKGGANILGWAGDAAQAGEMLAQQAEAFGRLVGVKPGAEAALRDWQQQGYDFGGLAVQSAQIKSAITDLAYSIARTRESSGRALSNRDVQAAIHTLGGATGSPTQFLGVLQDYKARLENNFAIRYQGIIGAPWPGAQASAQAPGVQRWGRDASGKPIRLP